MTNRISNTRDLLSSKRSNRKLPSLYESPKWDFPWSRSYGSRSWKSYRKTQYRTLKGPQTAEG